MFEISTILFETDWLRTWRLSMGDEVVIYTVFRKIESRMMARSWG